VFENLDKAHFHIFLLNKKGKFDTKNDLKSYIIDLCESEATYCDTS
jgi:hypothetical protein